MESVVDAGMLPKPREAWLPTHVLEYYTAEDMLTFNAALLAKSDAYDRLAAENEAMKADIDQYQTNLTAESNARIAAEAERDTLCQVCCGAKAGHHYSSCDRLVLEDSDAL